MSREVIDDEPSVDLDEPPAGSHRADVPDAYVPAAAAYAQDPGLVADVTPAASGPRASTTTTAAATRLVDTPPVATDPWEIDASVGAAPTGDGAGRPPVDDAGRLRAGRRALPPRALTSILVVLALVLGAYGGATTADQNARRTALDRTRIVMWPNLMTVSPGTKHDITLGVKAMSVGGPVLLHGFRSRFGTATVTPDVLVDATRGKDVDLHVAVDCSLAQQWRNDVSTIVTLGTALVKDDKAAPTREVPVEFTTDLVMTVVVLGCDDTNVGLGTDPSATPADPDAASTTSTDGTPRPVVRFTDILADDRGGLEYTASLAADAPRPVTVDTPVLALIAGKGPGKFAATTTAHLPYTLQPGDSVKVQIQLSYVCTSGTQVLPWTTSVLEPHVTAVTGESSYIGWDPGLSGIAVRGAIAKAGCSPPDDGNKLIVQ